MTQEERKHFTKELDKLETSLKNFALRYRAQKSGAYEEVKGIIYELKDYIKPDPPPESSDDKGGEETDDS